jgi:hypothetical protein
MGHKRVPEVGAFGEVDSFNMYPENPTVICEK